MNINVAIKTLLEASSVYELLSCKSEDYYNSNNPTYSEIVDVIEENGKIIILTR